MQAISGTDLPGMPAHMIQDQVVGHLVGEAEALCYELDVLFGGAFPVEAFATRVPVWRGHTITMAVRLIDGADAATVMQTLTGMPNVALGLPTHRDRFSPDVPLATIGAIRDAAGTVLMTLKGDNLEAATTQLMIGVLDALAL
ncbi:MAG: aspartate-semialdehyde dehydrogenase [Pseudorhodobacter sp.]